MSEHTQTNPTVQKPNSDVFISYKSEEKVEATWVKNVLNENKISCWMAPGSIPGGSSYADEINEAIKNCKILVLILSPQAQESKWIKKEVEVALNEGKTIMPFMIENFQLQNAFNFYLSDVQRFEAYENKALALKTMIQRINVILNRNSDEENTIQKEGVVSSLREKDGAEKNNDKRSFVSLKSIILTLIICAGLAFPFSLGMMFLAGTAERPMPALFAYFCGLLHSVEIAYFIWSYKYLKYKSGNNTLLNTGIVWAIGVLFTGGMLKIMSVITNTVLSFRTLNLLSVYIATGGVMLVYMFGWKKLVGKSFLEAIGFNVKDDEVYDEEE